MKILRLLPVAFAIASCFAVETHFWEHGDRTDFEKGTLTHLSLRSDGRLYLAPEFHEVFDSSTPYLWSVASDSKGNLYTAGGGSGSGTAKIFRVDTAGKSRMFAELDGLDIHGLALDSKDQLFAATDPDGKVYKISSDGKARVFFDPHQKYIWAMAFSKAGDLFVATGEHGEIYRVKPDGTGSVFFRTEETHARSLVIDAQDNLVVGTEPSGLILRVSPAGQGFVLYQSPKREITTVAVDSTGAIYAAGAGNKSGPIPSPLPPPPPPAPTPVPVTGNVTVLAAGGPGRGAPAVSIAQPPPAIAGGSDLYRINADGSPRKIWSNAQDIVYAITFDGQGRPLLGTGNRGRIYRVDSDAISTELIDASPTQVTSFGKGPQGELYAVTANIGKLYRLGPGLEQHGTYESEVLDAGSFSYWGRISYRGTGSIAVSTRAGNVSHAESNWSPWVALQADRGTVCDECGGGRTVSPAARFLQYKIELGAASGGQGAPAADVSYVEIAYLAKNVAPVVEQVEITPPNYRFPTASLSITPSTSITLPALGQPRRTPSLLSSELGSGASMNYAKGWEGARWLASDENSDTLIYKVEIRGVKETTWQLLKDGVKDKYLSWDGTAFPDGEYVVRVTASDAPSNPRDQALESSLIGDPFLIDNTPPQILNLAAAQSGNKVEVRWKAHDACSDIQKAEYSVNGGEWLLIEPVNKLTDSPEEDYRLQIDRTPGEQVIAVRVSDEFDNQVVDKVVVK
jgi:sugar lactone lactonase YvrE